MELADFTDETVLAQYGFVLVDAAGVIRMWSAGAQRVLGYTEEQAMGKKVDLLVPDQYREMHWKGFFAAMERGSLKNPNPPPKLLAVCHGGEIREVPARLIFLTDASGRGVGALGIFG
jgi:PAS domain S-box-containing protein